MPLAPKSQTRPEMVSQQIIRAIVPKIRDQACGNLYLNLSGFDYHQKITRGQCTPHPKLAAVEMINAP
jgi:hypothetical protein